MPAELMVPSILGHRKTLSGNPVMFAGRIVAGSLETEIYPLVVLRAGSPRIMSHSEGGLLHRR